MKAANPKLIGVFVIGGVMLLVIALVLFSSQDLFTPKRIFVAYFQQSVNGLNVGAPVRFRGIPVGEVRKIDGVYDPETGLMIPRLMMEFHPETLENAVVEEGEYTLLPLLLERGLRASLKSASLLTGQLYVALDFHPDIPERYLGTGSDEYPEMPTIDSGFDEALAKLSELPVEEMIVRVSNAFSAAEDLLRNPHIDEILAVLPTLLTDTDSTVVDLRQFINRDLTDAAQTASRTLAVARTSLQSLTQTINDETLVQVDSTLTELENTLQLVHTHLETNGPLMYELLAALNEISNAARSVRDLADALEEHPEALIRGKKSQ
jgi:paraquat-inducible protein B